MKASMSLFYQNTPTHPKTIKCQKNTERLGWNSAFSCCSMKHPDKSGTILKNSCKMLKSLQESKYKPSVVAECAEFHVADTWQMTQLSFELLVVVAWSVCWVTAMSRSLIEGDSAAGWFYQDSAVQTVKPLKYWMAKFKCWCFFLSLSEKVN